MSETIITSMIDTDLYKLTMAQVVLHQYHTAKVAYEFRCRNKGVKLGYLAEELRQQIEQWRYIRLTLEEKYYLTNKIPYLSDDYVEFLSEYRFNPDLVNISVKNDDLIIRIDGPWVDTILFEVPLLATINELHFRHTSDFRSIQGRGQTNLKDKINMISKHPRMAISEFGTRRRYSKEWQKYVLTELVKHCPQIKGTSNVRLAMELNIKAQGTMAHEIFSAHLALVDNISTAQKRTLYSWMQEYGRNLGTALADTFTSDAFFRDFDEVLSNDFSSVRHDSGDPIKFGWKTIDHYKKMSIDPRTKSIIFSDGLNVPKAIEIFETFTGLIGVSFGIGTNLSNDLGCDSLNIVIKLVECNGIPVVKISDEPGKAIGNKEMVERVKKAYGIV